MTKAAKEPVPGTLYRRSFGALLLLSTFFAAGCHSAAPPVARDHDCPMTAAVIALSPAKAEEISVDQLTLMLPHHPIVVGFDVDDTLIFSAPAFNALQPNYDPDVIRPNDYNKLTA